LQRKYLTARVRAMDIEIENLSKRRLPKEN
jgi:hypothetical protein